MINGCSFSVLYQHPVKKGEERARMLTRERFTLLGCHFLSMTLLNPARSCLRSAGVISPTSKYLFFTCMKDTPREKVPSAGLLSECLERFQTPSQEHNPGHLCGWQGPIALSVISVLMGSRSQELETRQARALRGGTHRHFGY